MSAHHNGTERSQIRADQCSVWLALRDQQMLGLEPQCTAIEALAPYISPRWSGNNVSNFRCLGMLLDGTLPCTRLASDSSDQHCLSDPVD